MVTDLKSVDFCAFSLNEVIQRIVIIWHVVNHFLKIYFLPCLIMHKYIFSDISPMLNLQYVLNDCSYFSFNMKSLFEFWLKYKLLSSYCEQSVFEKL